MSREPTKSAPYFRFWVKDWLSSRSVRVMTPYQRGLYIQLLCESWASGRPGFLPPDTDLWQLAGARNAEEFCTNGGEFVASKFKSSQGNLFNPKLLSELRYFRTMSKIQSRKAVIGNERRWHSDRRSDPAATPDYRRSDPAAIADYRLTEPDPYTESDPSLLLSFKKRKKKQERKAVQQQNVSANGSFSLPAWIPRDSWAAYLEMRLRIRKPMTELAKELACRRLERLKAAGFEPQDVLNQSILHSWQGLFPVRPDALATTAPEFTEEEFERMKAEIHAKKKHS